MPNLAVMYSATFPSKQGKRRLRESGHIGQKLNVPINMSGHYYNKKTKAKSNKETNYTIHVTDIYYLESNKKYQNIFLNNDNSKSHIPTNFFLFVSNMTCQTKIPI